MATAQAVVEDIEDNTEKLLHQKPEGPAVHPLKTLTPEQQQKMKELRSIVNSWNLAEPEQKFVDEMCLFRYLKGLNWDMAITKDQLKETVEWRAKFCPQNITLEDCKKVAVQNYLYTTGFDKGGRPIIYLLMGKDTLENNEENTLLKFKYIVYIMERAIELMPEGVYSITWIIDMKNSNLSLSTVRQTKDMFGALGNYYTERLCRTFVINAGWTLNAIWTVIKNFLAKETREKYNICKGTPQQIKDTFCQFIDESQLTIEYGGKNPYVFDFETQNKIDKERIAKVAASNQ